MEMRRRTGFLGRSKRWASGWRLGLAGALAIGVSLAGCGGRMPAELSEGRGRFAPCPASPNCVHSDAPDALHAIDPLRLQADVDPDDAWQAVLDVLDGEAGGDSGADSGRDQTGEWRRGPSGESANGERVEIVRSEPDYLYAVFTTPVMRYRDDVELALDRSARTIRVRSASRIGYGDMGANRARLESIRKSLADRGFVESGAEN